MKDYEFHPLANDYPLMPAYELGRLEEGMIERGFDERFPIVLFQGKILDGRNRYLAAKNAKLKAVPTTAFSGTEEAARLFVQLANEERRHLAPEWLNQRRQERIERVAASRAEGKSLRVIAEEEGVSLGQVQRDLEISTVSGDTVEPPDGKVTGKDGKKRDASKPKSFKPVTPKILCDRCARVGPTPDCERCADIASGKAAPPPPREPGDDTEREVEAAKAEPVLDDDGFPVPGQALIAFERRKDIEAVCRELDALIRTIEGLAKGPGGRLIRLDSVRQQLTDAKGNLWANRPTHVCPYCKGTESRPPCQCCKNEGWVAKHLWTPVAGKKAKKS